MKADTSVAQAIKILKKSDTFLMLALEPKPDGTGQQLRVIHPEVDAETLSMMAEKFLVSLVIREEE